MGVKRAKNANAKQQQQQLRQFHGLGFAGDKKLIFFFSPRLSRPPRAHPALADRRRRPQGQVQERRHNQEGQDEGQADGRRGNRKKMRGVAATIRKDECRYLLFLSELVFLLCSGLEFYL